MKELSLHELEFVAGGDSTNIYWARYTSDMSNPFGSLDWLSAVSGGADGWTLPNGESLGT